MTQTLVKPRSTLRIFACDSLRSLSVGLITFTVGFARTAVRVRSNIHLAN
ncbi:MAG: hypothetical protein ACI8V2_002864 [Candidatus Latescibacterota bacterium]|jgi:hypothetical protein